MFCLARLKEQSMEWATLVLRMIKQGTPCKESLLPLITLSRLSWSKDFGKIRFNDLALFVEIVAAFSLFVSTLNHLEILKNLFSSSNLDIAVSILLSDNKRRWFALIEPPAKAVQARNLTQFNQWLQNESQVLEQHLSSDPIILKFDTQSPKNGRRFDLMQNWKSRESVLSSNTDKTKK